MKPPKTTRFCINCNKITRFEYNSNVLHSECTECGCRNSINIKNIGKKDFINKEREKEFLKKYG